MSKRRRRRSLLNTKPPMVSRNPVETDASLRDLIAEVQAEARGQSTAETPRPQSAQSIPSDQHTPVSITTRAEPQTLLELAGSAEPAIPEEAAYEAEVDPTHNEVSPPSSAPGLLVMARMALAFGAAAVLSYVLITIPWVTLFSPALHTRLAARPAPPPPEPRIIEVIKPVPVRVEVPIPAPAIVVPEAEPEPQSVVRRSPRRRPRPAAEPVPVPNESVIEPVSEPVVVAPPPEPEPEPPPPTTPARANALDGKLDGKISGGSNVAMKLDFLPDGVLKALIVRDDVSRVANGHYSLREDGAVVALVEVGPQGASYTATVDADGLKGRVTGFEDRSRRVRLRR